MCLCHKCELKKSSQFYEWDLLFYVRVCCSCYYYYYYYLNFLLILTHLVIILPRCSSILFCYCVLKEHLIILAFSYNKQTKKNLY